MTDSAATPLDDAIAALDAEIASAPVDDREAFRVRFLGRKSGAVGALMGRLAEVPPEARRAVGQRLNALKAAAEARLAEADDAPAARPAAATDLDLTLPGRVPAPDASGRLHVLTQTLDDILGLFRRFGFSVARGPEIEDDWHNFTALHFPPDHPARDMQDTFFLEPPPPDGRGILLRTHTSPVQIRAMLGAVADGSGPPLRLVAPGRVYRNEAVSYKSFCLFHQVEGLVVDERVSMADLQAMLSTFAEAFFGRPVSMRFRPSFFPFTEVSAEVDVWWDTAAGAAGLRTDAGDGRWMEILGCGMVDPAVFEHVGVDAERFTGYAFGMGVERLAMLRHGIGDIRLLYENDLRFLTQF